MGGGQRGRGEERTWNMKYMVVTLDVSKLSGWLNADARRNMTYMVVTLDVSKLSGWLNADASCRESKEYRKKGIRCRASCGSGGRRAGDCGASSVHSTAG
eukprot:scaffold26979_cov53-Phaeocystis_antarctica.AAC.4